MKVICKKSITYHSVIYHKTFISLKNGIYKCQDYKDFLSVTDDNGTTYRFSPLDFTNYFYTTQELRAEKLKKINDRK